jgi:hypothetical protein
MIAAEDERILVQDAAHARARLRAVANHVAEADEGVVRVCQHRLEGLQVAVHIGDNKDFHKCFLLWEWACVSSAYSSSGPVCLSMSIRLVQEAQPG